MSAFDPRNESTARSRAAHDKGARGATAVSRSQLAQELHELIAALDRRVPHLERAEETSIARDAAKLRAQAVKRLAELTDELAAEAGGAPTART